MDNEQMIMCSVCLKSFKEVYVNIVDYNLDLCVKCEREYLKNIKGDINMEQINIYDELGWPTDPVYNRLSTLGNKESVSIGQFTVTRNQFGRFEISSEEIHECCQDLEKCYHKLNLFINPLSEG